jgi:hypothetical protein
MSISRWKSVLSFATMAFAVTGTAAWGQHVISAKSGVINYNEGEVFTNGKRVDAKPGQFPEWKKGEELTTVEGRAEILLTPGVFLRVAENSKLVLTENRLSDTRIQVVAGSVILECAELLEDNSVTLSYGSYNLAVRKAGLYRVDAEAGTAKVFEGELQVAGNGQTLLLRKGKLTQLGSLLVAEKFDNKVNDAFYRWASRRAEPLSVASFSGARSIYNTGSIWSTGGWYFNPYFGMFTYIPVRGYYNCPFGYRFYSPVVINRVYNDMAAIRSFNPGGNNGMNTWNRDSFYDSNRGYSINPRGDVGGGFSATRGGGMSGGMSGGGGAVSAPSAPAAGRGDMGGGGAARGDSGGGARGK